MAGAAVAAQAAGDARHLHVGLVTVRVHVLRPRQVDGGDAGGPELFQVACLVARVLVEVLAGEELRRVDEDRGDDRVAAVAPGDPDEAQMPSWR
jgi:hypothetical protein